MTVLAMAAAVCLAQEEKREQPSITVYGASEVRVAPNQVELRVGVRAQSRVLSTAVEQQRLQIKQAIALAISNGVEEKDIQTAYLGINPIREKGGVDSYYAHRDIAIALHDPARFDALLTALMQSGVNEVYGVEFKTTELRKYRDQARAQALTAAQEKAAALAGQSGRKLGSILSIEEQDTEPRGWGQPSLARNSSAQAPGGGGASNSLALGQISIEARLKVRFELQ
jgi:uncharacterized protein YggE